MCRSLAAVILLLLFLPSNSYVSAASFPINVRDSRGISVKIAAPPQRIVSLAPSITEMLFALGLGLRVVGDTTSCDYPESAKKITKVGDLNANYEKVISLHPDLVIADDVANRSAIPRLASLRLPLFAIHETSISEVESTLITVGALTGHSRNAAAVVRVMEKKRARARALVNRSRQHAPRVLIVIGTQPLWSAGKGTFMDEMVAESGAVNGASGLHGYAPLSAEAVLANPPDFIMAGPRDQAMLQADPILRTLPAVREHHFIVISDAGMFLRPGPRLADALLETARYINSGTR